MILALIAASIFASQPKPPLVDVCEWNRTYKVVNDVESLLFNQIILWRWSPVHKRHIVAEYWIIQGKPDRRRETVTVFTGSMRIALRAKSYRVSRTNYDPEQTDRAIIPCHERKPYFESVLSQ